MTALHRFRTGLQDVDLAVDTVFTPFDIHRTAVVFFNDGGKLGQFDHVSVSDGELTAVSIAHVNRADAAAVLGIGVEFHLDQLAAQVAADDREVALFKHGLVNIEFIGVHSALNNGFTQAVACRDEDHLIKTAFGIEREHHASGALVRAAHALNTGGQGHFRVIKTLVHAVADGAVVIEGSKHFAHAAQHLVDAHHVQVGFLLAGKRSIRQVFCGRRRTNGHADFFLAVL